MQSFPPRPYGFQSSRSKDLLRTAQQIAFAVLSIGWMAGGATAQSQPGRYKTIAHEILATEGELLPVRAGEYAFIDDVIDAAKLKITAMPTDRVSALAALKAVDEILVSRNVIYPGRGLVQYLHDGLTPIQLTDREYEDARFSSHNKRRRDAMAANKGKPFYVLDCDTASFLYLAVADALNWPVRLIEVPEHNFVRWIFGDGAHLNFETMDGVEMSDAHYMQGFGIPLATVKPGFFMWPMTHDDVMGYVRMLRGGGWYSRSDFVNAKQDYAAARGLRPGSPAPLNSEAWAFATCTPASCRDGALAVADATQAVALWRTGNYLDTLACAQASAGDFKTAAETETEARSTGPVDGSEANLAAINAGQVCPNGISQPPIDLVFALAAQHRVSAALGPLPRKLQGND